MSRREDTHNHDQHQSLGYLLQRHSESWQAYCVDGVMVVVLEDQDVLMPASHLSVTFHSVTLTKRYSATLPASQHLPNTLLTSNAT
jgi:hypothetical protein